MKIHFVIAAIAATTKFANAALVGTLSRSDFESAFVDAAGTNFRLVMDGGAVTRRYTTDGNGLLSSYGDGSYRWWQLQQNNVPVDPNDGTINEYFHVDCQPVGGNCEVHSTEYEIGAVGGVTMDSAVVGFRTDRAATVHVVYSLFSDLSSSTTSATSIVTSADDDFTGNIKLEWLDADKTYYYRIQVDGAIQNPGYTQEFRTFPGAGGSITFSVFSDSANQDQVAQSFVSGGGSGGPLFAMQIGDFDHSIPSVNDANANDRLDIDVHRAMHRRMRDTTRNSGAQFAENILSKMGFAHIWDDHDYCGNDSDGNDACKSVATKSFKEYYPNYEYANSNSGLWYKFTAGDADIFVVDTRSQRNPASGTMLGGDQLSWLLDGLQASSAVWKLIVSSTGANMFARALTSIDNWNAYSQEAGFIHDELRLRSIDTEKLVMVSGDIHTGGGIDNSCNNLWGISEISVPHTNLANGNSANIGQFSEGVHSGDNSAGDGEGYATITVTPSTLTLEVRDRNGNIKSVSGKDLSYTLPSTIDCVPASGGLSIVEYNVQEARVAIEAIINDDVANNANNNNFPAKFVRLGFHDCAGGCDGCIDGSNEKNNGLDIPINALAQVVTDYEVAGFTRADIWALAALVGAEMSQNVEDFPMVWTGRPNGSCGSDPMAGPAQNLPGAELDTHGVLSYFSAEFGFDPQQTAAIMGAHSLGKAHLANSGFVGSAWVGNGAQLNNGYYGQLIGDVDPFDPGNWEQELNSQNNYQWVMGTGNVPDENTRFMLNADIALVRDFSSHLDAVTGEVGCEFVCRNNECGNPAVTICPMAAQTFSLMETYRNDNVLFMEDFHDVLDIMLVTGHDDSAGCAEVDYPCALPTARRDLESNENSAYSSLRGSLGY